MTAPRNVVGSSGSSSRKGRSRGPYSSELPTWTNLPTPVSTARSRSNAVPTSPTSSAACRCSAVRAWPVGIAAETMHVGSKSRTADYCGGCVAQIGGQDADARANRPLGRRPDDGTDLRAESDQALNQIRADQAGGAGDEHPRTAELRQPPPRRRRPPARECARSRRRAQCDRRRSTRATSCPRPRSPLGCGR